MARSLGWIRQFHRPKAEAGPLPLLLVFPHAGSGASAYRGLSQALSDDFEVLLFQYPGRQDRMREATPATLPAFAEGAFAEFRVSQWAERGGFALLGHSMGALVAFEFARLAEAEGFELNRLFASAAAAPWTLAELPSHPKEDDAILAHLALLNGTETDLMQDQTMMRMAVSVIKGDYAAVDCYSCAREVRVKTTIHVLAGSDDGLVPPQHLRAWADHAEGEIEITEFPGGHFFLNDNMAEVVRTVCRAAKEPA